MRLLLVEDDHELARELALALTRNGYEVESVHTGREMLERYAGFDLVLLDLGLPDLDGLRACQELRARSSIPVIVVTARSAEVDLVLGLKAGADDYVVKPYRLHELMARIEAVMRRNTPAARPAQSEDVIQAGRIKIDVRQRRIVGASREINLTRLEFDLLNLLAGEPGTVFTREHIIEAVWGGAWYGSQRTVDVHVAALRRKLEGLVQIKTIRGVGFRIVTDGG
ncbi:MAG TPA: response regulator transcription factor [Actinocrinis sp.]|nr:response regulator transcription factor [Actinocrinis sp.]